MHYEIKHLHLELSSLCNARCPFCPRNFQGYPANMGYTETNLDLETVQKILPREILSKVTFILVNGNFGDFVENTKQHIIKQPLTKIDRKVECWAEKNKSVYIAADGHVYPCCWVGFNPTSYRNHTSMAHWNEEMSKYVHNNHAPTVGLTAAIEWFDTLSTSWNTDSQPGVCAHNCGK